MKKINIEQSVFKPIEQRQKGKANAVFLKLYAKLHKPKKTFDEAKSFTPPSGNINESL